MNWTDEYWEIIDFYYFEPQHLGRAEGAKRYSNANEMHAHVDRLEVSLNHILNLFFSLYPIGRIYPEICDESFEMKSALELEALRLEMKGATQPDLLFESGSTLLAIELKLGSKSSVDQIRKYILLTRQLGKSVPFTLLMLTPSGRIEKLFPGDISSYGELQEALGDDGDDVNVMVSSYDDLSARLQDVMKGTGARSVERRLLSGLITYLEKRTDTRAD